MATYNPTRVGAVGWLRQIIGRLVFPLLSSTVPVAILDSGNAYASYQKRLSIDDVADGSRILR